MAPKAALKDAGRALDMPYGDVDRLAKLVPNQLNITLEEALKQSPQLESMREKDERVKEVVEVAMRLEGLARHASTHAAGVVISPQPLTEIVPLYKSNKDEITTQYDMNALERIGLLKMDFLGLTTLTVLDDAVRHDQAESRHRHRSRDARAWTTRPPTRSSRAAIRPASSSLSRTACGTFCGATSRRGWKT